MKQLSFLLGSAFILAVGSAFATKPAVSPKFINYFDKTTCAAVSLPADCTGGNVQCKINGHDIVSGSCVGGTPVKLHQ